MNRFEIVAALFGVVSVFLSVRQNIWSWPTAIVNVGLYTFVFYQSRLYADMGLQVVYVVISFYGWYQWLYGGKGHTELSVSRTSRRLGVVLAGIGFTMAIFIANLAFESPAALDTAKLAVLVASSASALSAVVLGWIWFGDSAGTGKD